jgi:hypothetical protein
LRDTPWPEQEHRAGSPGTPAFHPSREPTTPALRIPLDQKGFDQSKDGGTAIASTSMTEGRTMKREKRKSILSAATGRLTRRSDWLPEEGVMKGVSKFHARDKRNARVDTSPGRFIGTAGDSLNINNEPEKQEASNQTLYRVLERLIVDFRRSRPAL